jgi:hypothetical protein
MDAPHQPVRQALAKPLPSTPLLAAYRRLIAQSISIRSRERVCACSSSATDRTRPHETISRESRRDGLLLNERASHTMVEAASRDRRRTARTADAQRACVSLVQRSFVQTRRLRSTLDNRTIRTSNLHPLSTFPFSIFPFSIFVSSIFVSCAHV